MFLISALTGIVDDFVAKKASIEVMNTPSSSGTINDCANGSPPPPPLCATTLLADLLVLLLPVTVVLTVLASLVATIASCTVSNNPFAS